MKLVSWAIIFVVIIFAFAFSIRINMNNKMNIMQEEIRYNNILDQSTVEATKVLGEQMSLDSESEEDIVLHSMQKFIDTFSTSMGYYGGKNSMVKQYIPAIITTTYDGFFVYSIDELIVEDDTKPSRMDHTLKPKIPYSFVPEDNNNVLVNFSLDNYVRIKVCNEEEIEGYIVDIRHFDDIRNAKGKYKQDIEYNQEKYLYEKSFVEYNEKRSLLEQWYKYNGDTKKMIYRRITPYTEDAYIFSKKVSNITGIEELTTGNSENTGFTNPITGKYEIGNFHKKRREVITKEITQKLKYYVTIHNKIAKAYDITYQFVLPVVKSTDWNNALDDVSVIAFVQGIPIMGKSYYNNYGFSNAKVVDKEVFYGFEGGIGGKIYFSSRQLDSYTNYILNLDSNVSFYYTAQEAANDGYYPYVGQNNNYIQRAINNVDLLTY